MGKRVNKKVLKIKFRDEFENAGEEYLELTVNRHYACCVKKTAGANVYILECDNGFELYSNIGGADFPIRKLSKDEYAQVIAWAEDYFNERRTRICAE